MSYPHIVQNYFGEAKALRMVGYRPVTLPHRPAFLLRPDCQLSR
jgi:hypothetical protein